jgi:hypothetical protein
MKSLKVISQNRYFTVIELYGERYINVKKSGVGCIKIEGQTFYKIVGINNQANTLMP